MKVRLLTEDNPELPSLEAITTSQENYPPPENGDYSLPVLVFRPKQSREKLSTGIIGQFSRRKTQVVHAVCSALEWNC